MRQNNSVSSAASDYGMNSGFYLIFHAKEMGAVVFQLVNRLVHIGQRRVSLLLFERLVHIRTPTLGQLLECADINVAIVKKSSSKGMYFTKNRRSCPMLLPHSGALPLDTYWLKNLMSCAWASSSVTVDALTLSIRPLRPCVPLFQASMASSSASLWWITSTGPSMRSSKSGPVTITAISMMRSSSGFRPVISQSSQTKFWSDFLSTGKSSWGFK